MLPIPKIIWHELTATCRPTRQIEPFETMDDLEQVRSYVQAYAWGGPTSALQLHHIRELSRLIRPGDTVLDLACGPGPLLLELASLFPRTRFIGADLSRTMLGHLEREIYARKLTNASVLLEDIREMPSLGATTVDLVVSTSALHHLPDESGLRQAFRQIRRLLKSNGGFYLFDFGLLKSGRTREIFVAEVAKLAPPLTAKDYDLSLQAAFEIDRVFAIAADELPRPYSVYRSAFVDFFYFLQSPPRSSPPSSVDGYVAKIRAGLPLAMRAESLMIRMLRSSHALF